MKTLRMMKTGETIPVGKILCLGRNYAEHARELHSEIPSIPLVFLKPSTAIISNGSPIVLPTISRDVHHEVELVVAIGREGKSIKAPAAPDFILGYGVGLDMTMRDVQNEAKESGTPWTVSKGFDTSAPLSDIIPADAIPDPRALEIRCRVNGAVRQHGTAAEMIFPVDRIIEYISSIFTLERGDLIFTGTPKGVSCVRAGDTVEAELIGFTTISHPVQAAG